MINLLKAAVAGARNGVRNEIRLAGGLLSGSASDAALSSGSKSTPSGKVINAKAAMEISAAYDCVRKTAQALATLPLHYYQKGSGDSRERINDGDLYGVLTESPNRDQTAYEFWEGKVAQICLKGNAYSERLYVGKRFVGLRPLFNVVPERDRENGGFKYGVWDRGRKDTLPADKVFHLRGFGAGDGLGMSTIAYGATSMGAALAAEETASSIFSNAMMAAGVLTSDQSLNDDQREALGGILADFVGSKRAGKILTLEAGLKYNPLQMNPGDAQLIETRGFSVEDVCRWFGTPPIIVGHSAEGQTMWGSGVEAILLSWNILGINPLATRIEKRIQKDLIPASQRRGSYFEFNREAMLQMDSKGKSEFLSKMGQSGTMTANERRSRLNLPRHDDPAADALLAQTALAPLETLGKDQS